MLANNDFSPKMIEEFKEDNFFTAYHDFLAWFFHKGFRPEFYEVTSILMASYEEALSEISAILKCKKDFDLEKKLKELNHYIQFEKSAISQIPRRSEIKAYINKLLKLTEKLFNLLHNTLPIIIDQFNRIHDNIYPQKNFKDITLTTQKIELQLQHLNAICLSISEKIDRESNRKLIDSINTLLDYFKCKGATISGIINSLIPLEKITSNSDDFIGSLKHALQILKDNHHFIIKQIGVDNGGREMSLLARVYLLKLAAIYKEACGEKPTIYKSESNSSGYDGTLHKLAMKCASLFTSTDMSSLSLPTGVGDLAYNIKSHL